MQNCHDKKCSNLEFPHTDRKKFQQISNLTLENIGVCPAAFNIVKKMNEFLNNQWNSLAERERF